MVVNPWSEKTGEQIFGSSPFVQYLKDLFSTKTHTHSKTDISDFNNHTHTKGQISNFSHSHSISDVTNLQTSLNAKQDTIPNFSLISNQTAKGMTVKVYSDGFNVYVTYEASPVTDLNTSSTNSGVTDILTLSNTDYAPKIQTQVPARGQADTIRIRITASGVVQFLNGSASATSYTVSGAFYFPLKSRIP